MRAKTNNLLNFSATFLFCYVIKYSQTYLTLPTFARPIKMDQIEFVAVRGVDDSSGIAIDEIILKGNGSCNGQDGWLCLINYSILF